MLFRKKKLKTVINITIVMINPTFLIIDPIIYLMALVVTPILFNINVGATDLCAIFLVFLVMKISVHMFIAPAEERYPCQRDDDYDYYDDY